MRDNALCHSTNHKDPACSFMADIWVYKYPSTCSMMFLNFVCWCFSISEQTVRQRKCCFVSAFGIALFTEPLPLSGCLSENSSFWHICISSRVPKWSRNSERNRPRKAEYFRDICRAEKGISSMTKHLRKSGWKMEIISCFDGTDPVKSFPRAY